MIASKMPPKQKYGRDDFQTPPYGVVPLLKYIPKDWIVWECAEGIGNITGVFRKAGYSVIGTDIVSGYNFFEYEPDDYDVIVTNPPYSEKDKWIEHCYRLKKPFALLLPITALEGLKRQKMYREFGLQVVFLNRRIDFVLPNKSKASSSWFATAWFANGLDLPRDMVWEILRKNGGQQNTLL